MIARRRFPARPLPTFGRRTLAFVPPQESVTKRLPDDVRLFALTFIGGFVFMSVYLA